MRVSIVCLTAFIVMTSGVAIAATDEKRRLIEELLNVTRQTEQGAGYLVQTLVDPTSQNAAISSEYRDALVKDTHATVVEVYDRALSDKQLRDLIAFFKSDLGQQFITTEVKATAVEHQAVSTVIRKRFENVEARSLVRRAMSDVRLIATGTEAYVTDGNWKYPPTMNTDALAKLLEPAYLRAMPRVDPWGHPYVYIGTADGRGYRVISGGPDGMIEESTKHGTPRAGTDDIIFQNGKFLAPLQSP